MASIKRNGLQHMQLLFRHGAARAMCVGREVGRVTTADGEIAAPKVGRVRETGVVMAGG
jgi:hypothetical protein